MDRSPRLLIKADLVQILKSVIASVVIKAQPPDLHKDPNRWIHLAVTTAERIWETEVTPLLQNTLLRSRPTIEQLGDIAMTWRCIHKVCEYKKETRFFAMKDVKRKLEITYSWSLEAASSVAEKRALESEYNASKRPRMEWGEEEQPIKEKMVLTSEEVGRLEEIVLAIPRSTGQIDSTAADLIPTPEDMKSLKEAGQWLEDSVLSSYLLLVCHHANGHFTEQARSSAPRWHVWSPHTHQLVESDDQSLWPPRHYPEAAVREVEMHLFPMCLDSHWVMVVMSKVEAGWSTRLVSSMTEYSSKVKNAWDDIAEW